MFFSRDSKPCQFLAMATLKTELGLLASQVILLRMRLLAIRSLLRGVIALRSFLRRRQRTVAGVQPAHIRVDPWVTVLIGRKRPLGSSRTADAVSKNPAVKPRGGEKETKMAIKGKNPSASTELTQTKPAVPHVVLLNPGTADHQASAQACTSPAPRPAENDVSRPDTSHKKASYDRQPSGARRPTQSYEDLRDYVLRR